MMSQNLEKIELFLSATGVNSSNPFAVVYETERKTNKLIKIGRTVRRSMPPIYFFFPMTVLSGYL